MSGLNLTERTDSHLGDLAIAIIHRQMDQQVDQQTNRQMNLQGGQLMGRQMDQQMNLQGVSGWTSKCISASVGESAGALADGNADLPCWRQDRVRTSVGVQFVCFHHTLHIGILSIGANLSVPCLALVSFTDHNLNATIHRTYTLSTATLTVQTVSDHNGAASPLRLSGSL